MSPTATELFETLLERNRASLYSFKPPPILKDVVHKPSTPENRKIFIISCSDNRIELVDIFKLQTGEAVIVRVAGGRTIDAIRTLEIIGSLVPIGLIVVMHHTDCGGEYTNPDEIRSRMNDRCPGHEGELEGKTFGTFGDIGLEESIRRDVSLLKEWKFLPREADIVGYVYETETGALREVK